MAKIRRLPSTSYTRVAGSLTKFTVEQHDGDQWIFLRSYHDRPKAVALARKLDNARVLDGADVVVWQPGQGSRSDTSTTKTRAAGGQEARRRTRAAGSGGQWP